eukprot:g827.t1
MAHSFTYSLIYNYLLSLSTAITQSIEACPEEIQPLLWENILLTGGSANFKFIRNRISKELRRLAPMEFDVNVYMSDDPVIANWRGGAIYASRPIFRQVVKSRNEYLERG